MARKSRQNQEEPPRLFTYVRHAVPFAYELFAAWRDRPKWEEVMADMELLAARSEKQARIIRILTGLVIVLALWCLALTAALLWPR